MFPQEICSAILTGLRPLKRWLTDRGIALHPKRPSNTSAKQTHPYPSIRPLETFAFDSPPTSPAQVNPIAASSALDNLFNRFINKQEQDLDSRAHGPEIGDNKAGLKRLFGDLNVLKAEVGFEDKERKQEDDALASLLGGLGMTPAPIPPVVTTQKQTKLLSLLNAPSPPPTSPPPASIKPHQASLLSVLSPKTTEKPSSTARPLKEPQSPISPSTQPQLMTVGEAGRTSRQRALLESITAGMTTNVPGILDSGPPQGSSGFTASGSAGRTDTQQTRNIPLHFPFHPLTTVLPTQSTVYLSQPPASSIYPSAVPQQPVLSNSGQPLLSPHEATSTSSIAHRYESSQPPFLPQQQQSFPSMVNPITENEQQRTFSNAQMGTRPQGHPIGQPPQLPYPPANPPFPNQPAFESQPFTALASQQGHHTLAHTLPLSQLPFRPPTAVYTAQNPPPHHILPHHPNLQRASHIPGEMYHHPVPRPPNLNSGVLLGILNDSRGGPGR
jgi:hypothetical protein